MSKAFDLNSNPTDVANALKESEARLATLKVQLQEEGDHYRWLISILDQCFGRGFPGVSGEGALRKVEANVKRSVTRVVQDKQKQGRAFEHAKQAAIAQALIVIDRYQLRELTETMSKHIDKTVAKVYGVKNPSLAARLGATR